ncbi:MAG: ferrous iron transport protein B [Candidatus Methanomethylophilaceae archaeon]|nr:ferrous iron transport protein B [Candidatus Methanomethylophilaceae archaeon]
MRKEHETGHRWRYRRQHLRHQSGGAVMAGCGACNQCSSRPVVIKDADAVVALAGNANVGKSVIFNQLTNSSQVIGNWPGKTVERAVGLLQSKGRRIEVVDLPGIYSFSTFSMEELVSRDFIALEHPDAVVNVLDATALERNLFFTIQLIELGAPMVIALNQLDLLEKKGLTIDVKKLEKRLGIPVIPTVAIRGRGISELSGAILDVVREKPTPPVIRYGKEVEERIEKLLPLLDTIETGYPSRWIAIKLLEKDPDIIMKVKTKDESVLAISDALADELETMHGEPSSVVITSERYQVADRMAKEAMSQTEPDELAQRRSLADRLDPFALHPVLGYFFVIATIGGLLVWTFLFGSMISSWLSGIMTSVEQFEPVVSGPLESILWNGAFTGLVAGVTLVIPYVLPFYLLLAVIEDSGYLTRIAFMLDRVMRKIGLHGKAIIPLILGYGCNVPACYSCRIMESRKQKLLSTLLVTLVPCTARTVVILGLVAAFVNIWWALALYAFDIALILIVGRIAYKVVPGESIGMIMEMPNYHVPSLRVVLKQTWARTKPLLWIVFPAYIIGSAVLQAFYSFGVLDPINAILSPITVWWLGLPVVVGILLVFGVVRKELTILMLAVIFGTTNFALVMTPLQLIVLALVTMIYIPCLATILVLWKEFGWKHALTISLVEIGLAILLGGIAFRIGGLL